MENNVPFQEGQKGKCSLTPSQLLSSQIYRTGTSILKVSWPILRSISLHPGSSEAQSWVEDHDSFLQYQGMTSSLKFPDVKLAYLPHLTFLVNRTLILDFYFLKCKQDFQNESPFKNTTVLTLASLIKGIHLGLCFQSLLNIKLVDKKILLNFTDISFYLLKARKYPIRIYN